MSRRFTFIALAMVLGSPALLAQSVTGPAPNTVGVGARVRIAAPRVRRDIFVGRIDSLLPAEVVLDTAAIRRRLGLEMGPVLVDRFRIVRLQTSAIEQVEVSAGKTTGRATLKGVLIGAAIGAVVIGVGQAPEVNPQFSDFVKMAPKGAIIGGALGGIVGFALGGERWLPARLP